MRVFGKAKTVFVCCQSIFKTSRRFHPSHTSIGGLGIPPLEHPSCCSKMWKSLVIETYETSCESLNSGVKHLNVIGFLRGGGDSPKVP